MQYVKLLNFEFMVETPRTEDQRQLGETDM
jgi:hypothetical protein